MGEAVLRIRAEGGPEVARLLADVERLVSASSRRTQRAQEQADAGYRTNARRTAEEAVANSQRISRARQRELALQGEDQRKFHDLFVNFERLATAAVEAETGKRGNLNERELRTVETITLAMVSNHEQAERRRTEATRRETHRRTALAREAAAAIAETAGAVHGATQAPRMETAQINATLAGAFGEGGASSAEVARMSARTWQFAHAQGLDPEQLATALQASQQQFSTLAGATPEERRTAMERSLNAARLAHDTQSNPAEVMRLAGALGDIGSPDAVNGVLRSAIGISRRGGVELGSLSTQNLGTIRAQMAAAVANLRRENPRASEADAQRAMVDAFTQTLSTLEVLAPRGIEGRRAGTAVRQLGSALHDPRVQTALRTRLTNVFGARSGEVTRLFDEQGALRADYLGAQGGENFGRAIMGIAGGDPDQIRALLGRGTRTGDRGEVLHANQRDLVAALAGQDSRGRTGWDALATVRAGAGDVTDADVARTREIVQGLDATRLARTRTAGMMAAREPGLVTDASDAAADFAARHPYIAAVGGGRLAQMAWQRSAAALASRGGVRGVASTVAQGGLTAASIPALATAGAVLSYTGDSVVSGDEESAMLRRYRATHARPAAAAAAATPPTVDLSPRSVQQIADAMSRATITVSQHDAVHAATVAQTHGAAR